MTELLENALRKVISLRQEQQNTIAARIIETCRMTRPGRKAGADPNKFARLAQQARAEHERGETRALDELL